MRANEAEMKRYHIEILLFFILTLAFGYGVIMFLDAVRPVVVQPSESRNEWGQAPATLEELCEGTILQWSVRCTSRKMNRKDI